MTFKNRFSAQRQRIHAFAVAWAKADMGPGYHAHGGMARGLRVAVITDYATNWLAEHGEMPDGVHTCRATRKIDFCSSPPSFTVDFSPLHRLASSGKGTGRQQQPAADPVQGSPAEP
ncbi:MAG: hypothetical protein EOR74_21040 [Mesorhizobium sp.]|nr:MAG: hypothetical protein EOR74_21040 [Mesorhizobium sp.]